MNYEQAFKDEMQKIAEEKEVGTWDTINANSAAIGFPIPTKDYLKSIISSMAKPTAVAGGVGAGLGAVGAGIMSRISEGSAMKPRNDIISRILRHNDLAKMHNKGRVGRILEAAMLGGGALGLAGAGLGAIQGAQIGHGRYLHNSGIHNLPAILSHSILSETAQRKYLGSNYDSHFA